MEGVEAKYDILLQVRCHDSVAADLLFFRFVLRPFRFQVQESDDTMAKFMILCRGGEVDAPQYKTHMQKWRSWLAHLIEAGRPVPGEPPVAVRKRGSGKGEALIPHPPRPHEDAWHRLLLPARLPGSP